MLNQVFILHRLNSVFLPCILFVVPITGTLYPSIGKVQNVDCDGPAAINHNFTDVGSIGFPIEVVITCTWSTEQAMREIYLKPFEIAVKRGGADVTVSRFTEHPLRQLFAKSKMTRHQLNNILISRCWDKGRPDIDRLLENIGLEHYTPNNPSPRFSQARPPYIKQCRIVFSIRFFNSSRDGVSYSKVIAVFLT